MLVLVFPRDLLGLPQARLAALIATRIRGGTAALIGPGFAWQATSWTC